MTSFLINTFESLYKFEAKTVRESVIGEKEPEKLHGIQEYIKREKYNFVDDVLDIPDILEESIKSLFYKTFNQLSFQSGTGELSLNYYTEIKCSKYRNIYEDGIGLTTLYILSAMVENVKQVNHYINNGVSSLILNDDYFKAVQNDDVSTFYIDSRNVEENYFKKVKNILDTINSEGLVKLVYIDEETYKDKEAMRNIIKKCEFISLDRGPSFHKYWEECFTYYGFNKLISIHHLGYLFPLINKQELGKKHSFIDYSVSIFPIHEKNKTFQNGCMKIFMMHNSPVKLVENRAHGLKANINYIKSRV